MNTGEQREVAREIIKGLLLTHEKGLSRMAVAGMLTDAGIRVGIPTEKTTELLNNIITEILY
jgi:hypothetical protein